jgi:RNA polymerase sigma-70 factor (ECF subfamily)
MVTRFKSGEPGVFDEIVDRYQRHVYRVAYRFTHNTEDAYDICQEVFVKVFKSLGGLRDEATLHTWLRRIAVNTCIDYLRQQSRKPTQDDLHHPTLPSDTSVELPNRPLEMQELRSVIIHAVDQLPKRQKRVFMLRHYEDLSLKEVARTLECPLNTVKANLFHANRKLRKLLRPYVS